MCECFIITFRVRWFVEEWWGIRLLPSLLYAPVPPLPAATNPLVCTSSVAEAEGGFNIDYPKAIFSRVAQSQCIPSTNRTDSQPLSFERRYKLCPGAVWRGQS